MESKDNKVRHKTYNIYIFFITDAFYIRVLLRWSTINYSNLNPSVDS